MTLRFISPDESSRGVPCRINRLRPLSGEREHGGFGVIPVSPHPNSTTKRPQDLDQFRPPPFTVPQEATQECC
jgi:hypothetical protein